MKLSIITINRNNAEGLRRTIASVASQTYRDIEHIIIDGASTDDSVDVIREYAEDQTLDIKHNTSHSVSWVSEPDKGIYNAINKGIEIALGRRVVDENHTSHIIHNTFAQSDCDDYIWILNSGDCAASPNVVERMMDVIIHYTSIHNTSNKVGIPILLGNIIQVHPDGRKIREAKYHSCKDAPPRPIDTSMLTFYRGTVPQDAAFVRRDLFEKYGLFDETMRICSDWKLYLDMIALGGVVPMYVDIDVVHFDMSGISNANNELRLAERRAYLEKILPPAVLKDYDAYATPIAQYNRIREHHLWGLVHFMERVLFKLEKWGVLH